MRGWRRAGVAALLCLLAGSVCAQPVQPGQKVTLGVAEAQAVIGVVGETTVLLQLQGTWTATISFEASLDGATFTALSMTPLSSTTPATTASANGIWTATISGVTFIRARVSAYTNGSAQASFQTFYIGGGGGSSGGGASGNVSITQGGNTAAVNGSSQLSVNCANCSGSGVSQQDNTGFVPGTTNFVPVGGEVDDVGTTAIAENSAGAARLTVQRGLHVNLRNVAGAETGVAAVPLQVSLANTAANATAVKVDGSAVTQPVSGTVAATQSGAWTLSANQSVNVAQINGVTPLMGNGVTGTGSPRVTIASDNTAFTVNAAQSGTWTVQPGNTANTTPWLQIIRDAAGNARGANVNASFQLSTSVDNTVTVASHAVTNAGTFAIQDSEKVADDAAFTVGTTKVQPAGFVADESSTDSVNEDDIGAPRMTLDRVAYAAAAAVTASAQAASACNILSAASTNSTNCKGSAGNLYGFEVFNTSTTVYFLRLYNASSAPTCSSATGFIRSIPIPPASAAGQVGGIVSNQTVPVNFGTGIGYCITGGSSSTDNTNAATGVFGEIRYK